MALANKHLFWLIKLAYLCALGGFFFLSYGLANWITSLRPNVSAIVFDWEQLIPLWSWTVIPYWSIDLFYGLAILSTTNKTKLNILSLRLLTAQLICVSCFLLFPLRFSVERPHLDGLSGLLFDILMGFDKPFNQAPSLHITLLVILWYYFNYLVKTLLYRVLLHGWFLLIGLSVLTTWQHHFIDVPTGVLAGCLSIWLWPNTGKSPLAIKNIIKHQRIASYYCIASMVILMIALYFNGIWLWLCWLSISFALVASNYIFLGRLGFQKQSTGQFQLPIKILYGPYFILAWINRCWWTRYNNPTDHIIEQIYLGRIPDKKTLQQQTFITIIDFCAELPMPSYNGHYYLLAVLDLTLPPPKLLTQAVNRIEQANQQGDVLVCCALGYSRSALAIIAWLLWSQRAKTIEQAINIVKSGRHNIVITTQHRQYLMQWLSRKSNE